MNATTDILARWQRIGGVDPTTLADARLQLHHALQVIVSAPISFLEQRPDDSHTNLEWLAELGALGTNWLVRGTRVRYALRPATLSLLAIDDRGQVTSEYLLDNRTTADAVAWLRGALVESGYDGSALTTKKHYEIPSHPVASGRAFSRAAGKTFAEFGHYYANTHELTSHVAATRSGASAPRCWPHHFDLATLIVLPELPGTGTRTVGVGLSPGDDLYAEPYFYVGPYPPPTPDRLKPLGSLGTWHTKGWVGAVLRGGDIVRIPTPDGQAQAVLGFADAAIEVSVEVLSASP